MKSNVPIIAPNIGFNETHSFLATEYINRAGNFNYYSGQTVQILRSGNVVEIAGTITPKESIEGSATAVEIMTLPSGYEPKAGIISVQQGSGKNTWNLNIGTNGVVTFSRYGIGNYVVATPGTWLPFHVTYLI